MQRKVSENLSVETKLWGPLKKNMSAENVN